MEPAGSGATWTGSPKGVFAGRKHHKPRQGVVANTQNSFRNGAVGFIDWLDLNCAKDFAYSSFGCLRIHSRCAALHARQT